MAKDTLWFPHDYNARADEKTDEAIEDYGTVAYGEYWVIAEMLHEELEGKIELTDRFYRVRSKAARMDIATYKQFIEDCINKYMLFKLKDGYITSERVERNKDSRQAIRNKRAQAGKEGAAKRWENSKCHEKEAKTMANAKETIANANGKMANDSTGQDKTGQDNSIVSSKEDIYISDELKKKYEKNEWFKWKCADTIIRSKEAFKDKIKPFVEKYGADLCNDFWYYWTQPQTNKSGKIAWELEKKFDIDARLRTFRNNNKSK